MVAFEMTKQLGKVVMGIIPRLGKVGKVKWKLRSTKAAQLMQHNSRTNR